MNKKFSLTSKTYIVRPELELTDIVAFILRMQCHKEMYLSVIKIALSGKKSKYETYILP